MPSSGGGTGTPIVPGPAPPDVSIQEWCTGALPLATYAQKYVGAECGMWGVSNPDERNNFIWTLFQRQELARALCEAQEEIEKVAGFFLQPKWIEEEPHRCSPTGNYTTLWNYIIDGGVGTVSTIQAGAVVDHTADPAVVGSIATAVMDPNEVKVYYPGTDQEITPSNIVISGGSVTVYIPRCRLVGTNYIDNPDGGLDYNDLSLFQQSVDVMRIYNDTSDPGEFVIRTAGECENETLALCIDVKDSEIGSILAYQTANASCRVSPVDQARLNYVSGLTSFDRIAELAIVRLAHSKMPGEPCGYDRIKEMWRKDNTIPVVLSVERLECPFGVSNGAWMAWKFAGQISVDRMSVWA